MGVAGAGLSQALPTLGLMDGWRAQLTPRQERVLDGLLGWGPVTAPRPPADDRLVARVRDDVQTATAAAAALVPRGRRLVLGKSALEALSCDGRFVDRDDTPFAYNAAMVRGQVAHTAIGLDFAGGRQRSADEVVVQAWRTFADGGGAAAAFLRGVGGVEADALRADAAALLLEFRDLFPPLPAQVPVRCEPSLGVRLHEGRIGLFGRPDLVLGRAHPTQRRLLLVDLKSGWPSPWRDRAEMRFYALLATLKYGVAPFRIATFYLDDASWDEVDVDESVLEAAVRSLGEKTERAARLTFDRPPPEQWQLQAGPGCTWCSLAPSCLVRAKADAADAGRAVA